MLIIWGSKGVEKTVGEGNIQCPVCNLVTAYELKVIQKYFTLFFIPLFPYGKKIEYLECQRCKVPFKPEFFGLHTSEESSSDHDDQDCL